MYHQRTKSKASEGEPRCVICSTGFYFREPTHPFGPKCPLVLHCGHSACEGCLVGTLQKKDSLTCPVCTKVSESKKLDPKNMKKEEIASLREDFPLNVYAVGQVSLKRNKSTLGDGFIKFSSKPKMADNHAVACNECNGRAADCSCVQCKTQLCDVCFANIHSISVTLRRHERITLTEMQANKLFEENLCKMHNGLYLNIYCKDCEIYMCRECSIEKHLEHYCTDVFQQNEAKLPEFSQLFGEANDVLQQLRETKKKVQQTDTQGQVCDEEAKKVEKQVQTHYNYLHGMLQREEEQLLKKIRSVGQLAQKSLDGIAEELDKNIKEVDNVLTLSNCIASTKKINEFPLDCLIDKLKNITGTPCHLVLDDGEDNSKFEFQVDMNISEVLREHCTLSVPDTRNYQLCSKFDLPGTAEVKIPNNVDNYKKPDLPQLKTVKDGGTFMVQKALLNAIASPSPPVLVSPTPPVPSTLPKEANTMPSPTLPVPLKEANTKPSPTVPVPLKEATAKPSPTPPVPLKEANTKPSPLWKNRTSMQKNSPSNHSGSTLSISSQESAVEKICNVKPLTEGSSESVQICLLSSPSSFYVQRKCNIGDIEKMENYFSKNANRSKIPPTVVEVGQIYLVQYSKDKKWYRGRVNKVDGRFCDVFYVDYGNIEVKVPINKIRDIPDKYADVPSQAVHCGLHSCMPIEGKWSPAAHTLMRNMADSNDLTMYVETINHNSGLHEVYLRKEEDMTGSFTDALVYMGHAVQISDEGGLYKHMAYGMRKNPFKNTTIKERDVFDGKVSHVNSPTHFYMQKFTDGGDLLVSLMTELTETYSKYAENQGLIYTPCEGMPVAAKFQNDGNWYRAIILGLLAPKKVLLKYVDFGNVEKADIEDIRELQTKFLRIGAQGLRCSLHDIAPKHPKGWHATAKNVFEKMVMNKGGLLRAHVEKVNEDNSLSILLYETTPTMYINISGVLVKKRHAVSTGQTSARAEYPCRSHSELKDIQEQILSDSESDFRAPSEFSKASEESKNTQKKLQTQLEERTDDEVDARVKVEVLKVMSPFEIYITPTINTRKQIDRLTTEMTAYYMSLEQMEERDWTVGDLCAVMKEKEKKWYRGVITDSSHTNYKVFIKDIVEVMDVDKSLLRSLEERFCKVQDGSAKVHLVGVKVPANLKTWPATTTDYLRQFVCSAAIYIEKLGNVVNDSLPVCMWRRTQKQGGPLDPIMDEWCDVSKSLVSVGLALPDSAAEKFSRFTSGESQEQSLDFVQDWLETSFQRCTQRHEKSTEVEMVAEAPYVSELEKEDNMSVISSVSRQNQATRANRGRSPSQRAIYIPGTVGHEDPTLVKEWTPALPFQKLDFICQPSYVDFDCNIYIQDIDSASTLELLEKAFMSLFENSLMRPYEEDYLEGQICIAFFEPYRKWYRGKVLKVKPEHIEVLFVDYGNVEELQPQQLRKQVTMAQIPIQCHKCRTEGIIPISPDGKWPIRALDFVHGAVVDQKCDVKLKAPNETCEDYVLLSLKLPGGQDLLETLLSMHYATYIIDCETVGAEDDEYIIEDQEVKEVYSNIQTSKMLVREIQDVIDRQNGEKNKEAELIEDHIKTLQNNENNIYNWYEMTENPDVVPAPAAFLPELDTLPAPAAFLPELDTTFRSDLRFKNFILPDSAVEFSVSVQIVSSYSVIKVIITSCEDPEVKENLIEFAKIQTAIQQEAESLPEVKHPAKDLVCIGCFLEDDIWYRAVITNVFPKENMVQLYYVDYGNTEKLPVSRLRVIKPEWTLIPVQAVQVMLHNVRDGPNYDAKACQTLLIDCLQDSPYTMTIEKRFPSLEVELYDREGKLAYTPCIDAGMLSKD